MFRVTIRASAPTLARGLICCSELGSLREGDNKPKVSLALVSDLPRPWDSRDHCSSEILSEIAGANACHPRTMEGSFRMSKRFSKGQCGCYPRRLAGEALSRLEHELEKAPQANPEWRMRIRCAAVVLRSIVVDATRNPSPKKGCKLTTRRSY